MFHNLPLQWMMVEQQRRNIEVWEALLQQFSDKKVCVDFTKEWHRMLGDPEVRGDFTSCCKFLINKGNFSFLKLFIYFLTATIASKDGFKVATPHKLSVQHFICSLQAKLEFSRCSWQIRFGWLRQGFVCNTITTSMLKAISVIEAWLMD